MNPQLFLEPILILRHLPFIVARCIFYPYKMSLILSIQALTLFFASRDLRRHTNG